MDKNYRPTLVIATLQTLGVNLDPELVEAGAQAILDENGLPLLDEKGRELLGM